MFRQIISGACLVLSTVSYASHYRQCRYEAGPSGYAQLVCYQYVNQQRVLENINAQPVNAGINPEFSAYTVNGTVELASNACQAQGLQATLDQQRRGYRVYVVARVSGWKREDIACTTQYNPVRVNVSTTVRGNNFLVGNTFILNAESFGNVAPLGNYVN